MAMLRGAITNERAREQLSDFIQSRWLHGAGRGADHESVLRAGIASSMLVGIITSRHIIGVPALASAGREELVARVAPLIEQLLIESNSPADGTTSPARVEH